MHPIRFGAAPLASLVLITSFVVDAMAATSPTTGDPVDPMPASKPVHRRHVSKRPIRALPEPEAAADGAEHGVASYYSHRLSGRPTASGEAYDPTALTAAHRTLPLGTQVRVVNPKNDKSVVVTVNDRGPIAKNRMIDVSSAAADQLQMKQAGVTRVRTHVVGKEDVPKDDPVDAAKTH